MKEGENMKDLSSRISVIVNKTKKYDNGICIKKLLKNAKKYALQIESRDLSKLFISELISFFKVHNQRISK